MYIAYKRLADSEALLHRMKKSESVKNETVHKGVNRLVAQVSHRRLDSTVLTARRQRTGTTEGEDTGPRTHSPSRPTRSHTRKVA